MSIATLSVPLDEMGFVGAYGLIDIIEGKRKTFRQLPDAGEVIERDSVSANLSYGCYSPPSWTPPSLTNKKAFPNSGSMRPP